MRVKLKSVLTREGLSLYLREHGACKAARAWQWPKTLAEAAEALPYHVEPERSEWTFWFMTQLVGSLATAAPFHLLLTARDIRDRFIANSEANHHKRLEGMAEADEVFAKEVAEAKTDAEVIEARTRSFKAYADTHDNYFARRDIVRGTFVAEVVDFVLNRLIPYLEAQSE